jgi:hypothetical protein
VVLHALDGLEVLPLDAPHMHLQRDPTAVLQAQAQKCSDAYLEGETFDRIRAGLKHLGPDRLRIVRAEDRTLDVSIRQILCAMNSLMSVRSSLTA